MLTNSLVHGINNYHLYYISGVLEIWPLGVVTPSSFICRCSRHWTFQYFWQKHTFFFRQGFRGIRGHPGNPGLKGEKVWDCEITGHQPAYKENTKQQTKNNDKKKVMFKWLEPELYDVSCVFVTKKNRILWKTTKGGGIMNCFCFLHVQWVSYLQHGCLLMIYRQV